MMGIPPFFMAAQPYSMLRPGLDATSALALDRAAVSAVAALSPVYPAYYAAAAALSPSYSNFYHHLQSLSNPSSPLAGSPGTPRLLRNMAGVNNPLHSLNHMRLPHIGSPTTSNAPFNSAPQHSKKRLRFERAANKEENRIKKPLNAFMLFMKKNRQKLIDEEGCKDRQSAELNRELGRRWRELMTKEDRQPYFDMAKEEEQKHKEKYPQWSARENYAINRKKKRRPEKSLENLEMKKCRARYGLAHQDQWCKHCKRKKRCLWASAAGLRTRSPPGLVSSTTPGTPRLGPPGTPLMLSSPYSSIGGGPVTSSCDEDSDSGEDPLDLDMKPVHGLT